jgi:excisionase family DNA binding protein
VTRKSATGADHAQHDAIGGSDDVLDVPGAMELLKMGRNAVYDACGRNEIPHRRIGKLLRFSRAALLRWLEGEFTFRTTANVGTSRSCGRLQDAQEGQ